MSKFRNLIENILKEAKQVGILYHATRLDYALSIVKDNTIHANPKVQKDGRTLDLNSLGISTSRNKLFMYKGDVEIMLDGDKLSEKYSILPYNYFNDWPTEELTSAEKRNTAESIIISKSYLNSIKKYSDEDAFDNAFDNPFSIPNINEYILGFMVAPNIFGSNLLTRYLKELIEISNKPVYTYSGQKLDINAFDKYTQDIQAKGKVSKIDEYYNLQDVLYPDELDALRKERDLEAPPPKSINLKKQISNDKTGFLTKDNNRWHKF